MKFVRESSPYIRKNVSVKRMMLDVLIALVPVVLFACIQNGFRGVWVLLTSILTMLFIEFIAVGLMKWPDGMKRRELFKKEGLKRLMAGYDINNLLCPMISGTIFALLLPAGTPVYVIIVGATMGILFGKLVFGAYGGNIFNPAAVAFIITKICFDPQLSAAITENTKILFPELIVDGNIIAGGTPLGQIANNLGNFANALGTYSLTDLLIGNVPGSMGEVCSVLIVLGGLYLLIRRSADFRVVLSMLVSSIIVFISVGIVMHTKDASVNVFDFVAYQVMAGGLLFGAFFMMTDPVTSPISKFGRVAYGVFAGLMVALIRFVSAAPEGVAYAILLANLIAPAIDYLMRGKKNGYTVWQGVGTAVVIAAVCAICCVVVNGRVDAVESTKALTSFLGGF